MNATILMAIPLIALQLGGADRAPPVPPGQGIVAAGPEQGLFDPLLVAGKGNNNGNGNEGNNNGNGNSGNNNGNGNVGNNNGNSNSGSNNGNRNVGSNMGNNNATDNNGNGTGSNPGTSVGSRTGSPSHGRPQCLVHCAHLKWP